MLKIFLVAMIASSLTIALSTGSHPDALANVVEKARPISEGAVLKFWGPEICISSSHVH